MMGRTQRILLWVAALAVVGGCDRTKSAPGGLNGPVAEVRLGFFPNVTHAQAVLGTTSGDFAKAVAPAAFTHREFNAGPSLIEALFAKQIDIGFVGPGPVLTAFARSHGDGIRVVSGAAANGVVIVARPGAGINTLADLRGKKLATPQYGNTQDIAARHYLTATLHQADLSNVLPVANADQLAMLARGQIDAAWDPEPWGSLLSDKAGATVVGEEKDLWPDHVFALTVIVTTPEFLAAHPDVVQKVLGVNRDWTDRLTRDPTRCAPQLDAGLTTLNNKALPTGVVASALTRVKFTEDPMPATFTANAQWAYDLGFARDEQDLTGLIDTSVLQKLPPANAGR